MGDDARHEQSLCDAIGGMAVLRRLSDTFYGEVLGDPGPTARWTWAGEA